MGQNANPGFAPIFLGTNFLPDTFFEFGKAPFIGRFPANSPHIGEIQARGVELRARPDAIAEMNGRLQLGFGRH
jgi:hypothetical protein